MPGRKWKPDEYSVTSEGQVDSFPLDNLRRFLSGGEMGPAGERGGECMRERMYLPPLERVRGSTELGNQLLAAPWAPWPLCFGTPSLQDPGKVWHLTISILILSLSSHIFLGNISIVFIWSVIIQYLICFSEAFVHFVKCVGAALFSLLWALILHQVSGPWCLGRSPSADQVILQCLPLCWVRDQNANYYLCYLHHFWKS